MARSAASMCLSEAVSHFEHLDDPRSTINRLHPLPRDFVDGRPGRSRRTYWNS